MLGRKSTGDHGGSVEEVVGMLHTIDLREGLIVDSLAQEDEGDVISKVHAVVSSVDSLGLIESVNILILT